MSAPIHDPIHVAPFVAWVDARVRRYAELGLDAPLERALGDIGWANHSASRRLSRWRISVSGLSERGFVEDALDHAEASWQEVYDPEAFPGVFADRQRDDVLCWIDAALLAASGWDLDDAPVRERWCPHCREQVSVDVDDSCLWCTGPTNAERPCRRGGPRAGQHSLLTDAHLRALHIIYEREGASVNALAQRIYERAGYARWETCANAIYKGWQRLNLPRRDRLDAVRQACTIHGLAPKHGPRPGYGTVKRRRHKPDQPQCEGVRTQPPGKGDRCQRPATAGSKFCPSHDPELALARQTHLASLRQRRVLPPMLPFAPMRAWLGEQHAELGSWRAVGELVGMDGSQVHRWGRGIENGRAKTTVGADVVARVAAAAGVPVTAIYTEEQAIAA